MVSSVFRVAIVLFIANPLVSKSQGVQFYNPVEDGRFVIRGQGWGHQMLAAPFDRLPSQATEIVLPEVWALSRNAAGIYIVFRTNSSTIHVKYQVSGDIHMSHMPATGSSGLDLYRYDRSGIAVWCKGKYLFKDTIVYSFSSLMSSVGNKDSVFTYQLYLPLYNTVPWMEIGVDKGAVLEKTALRDVPPIVVYGTSIAQGACASRPGMAWTSLFQRRVGLDVVNLGFSGNGRLEPEMIGYLASLESKLTVLDCLPNLISKHRFPNEDIVKRFLYAVRALKEANPNVPILLVQHAGYSEEVYDKAMRDEVERLNTLFFDTWTGLMADGIQGLFLLSKAEIAMCSDCTVDGTHQTDLGMLYYAKAYEKKYYQIFPDEIGLRTALWDE